MRLLLVDDHDLMVEALSGLLSVYGYDIVGTAADGYEAMAQASALQPDLILMDLRMPNCDGLAATRLIKARQPGVRIVVLTTSAEDQDLFAAIQSGACGYLLKSSSSDEFIEALRGLEEGIPPFSPGLAARLLEEFARVAAEPAPAPPMPDSPAGSEISSEEPASALAGLTARQTEVLRHIAGGETYRQVALQLNISERTVRYHMAEIMDRLHLEHRSQVIAWAGQRGLGRQP